MQLFICNVFSQTYNWEFLGLNDEDTVYTIHDIQIASNGYIFAGTELNVIFRSTDNGISWENIRPSEINWTNPGWKIVIDENDSLFLCTIPGVWKSADYGESWRYLMNNFPHPNGPGLVRDMLILPNKNYVAACMGGIYFSEDDGITWNYSNSNTANDEDLELGLNGYVFAANPTASWFGLYRSTDGGINWDEGWGLPTWCFTVMNDSTIFAGTDYGLYKTTDHGENWIDTGVGIYADELFTTTTQSILSMASYNSIGGVYLSEDEGLTWNLVFDKVAESFAQDSAGFIYAGTTDGIYRIHESALPVELVSFNTSVNGNIVLLNWTTASEINNKGFEIQRLDDSMPGSEWSKVGFVEGKGTTTKTHNYSFIDKYLESGLYKYRLKQVDYNGAFEYSKMLTIEIIQLTDFRLYQNYPNPFNNNTVIKYSIRKNGPVSLNMYNLLGEHLVTLVNEVQNSGKYQIEFDATKYDLNSGIYLLKLQNDEDFSVVKLIYLK
jgi:photosystem II stability/assembly factor-like uncharacterized protein